MINIEQSIEVNGSAVVTTTIPLPLDNNKHTVRTRLMTYLQAGDEITIDKTEIPGDGDRSTDIWDNSRIVVIKKVMFP